MTERVQAETGARSEQVSTRALVVCLAYAALTGGVVAGLGNPLIYEVSVARDVPVVDAQWMVIATLLAGAVGTPVLSRLADGPARKRVLIGTLLVLGLASAVALIPTFPAVIATRSVQGLGYALVPLTVSLARAHLGGEVLTRTLAMLSLSVSLGVGLGNPMIGLLVGVAGYRAPFLLVTVVGLTAAWLVARTVPAAPRGDPRVAVDLPGAALLALGLGALLLAVARGGVWGWTSIATVLVGGAGVALLAVWALVELRVTAPLVDLRLVCSRTLLGVNVVAMLIGIGMFAGASTVMVLVQTPTEHGVGLGRSVFVAGLLMLPMALVSLVTPPVGLWAARRIGYRVVLAAGALTTACAFGYFARWHDSILDIVVMMVVMGVGVGLAYSVMPAVVVAVTPYERVGTAMGVNQVLRLAGGSAGGAVVAAILAAHTRPGAHDPAETGFVLAAVFASGGALVAALVALLLLPRGTGRGAGDPDGAAEVTVDTPATAA
ncbi:MFS transporter [Nocardioides nitrophenolicus]|uniref:MFS transporter n=1 Tax=Nocardioides nitrophenolicus TaxID=60489 RepID=UPI00195A1F1A|nr:MFS transporter [Nocardioides nitrophenolicus]MBM7516461.1 MFS family permease [Nocardioides nitrophenolicus]